MTVPRFQLGRIVATPSAVEALEEAGQGPAEFLHRHASGDWGTANVEDQRANEAALRNGSRIFSAYLLKTGVMIWVITEATDDSGHRASTCILLPQDY